MNRVPKRAMWRPAYFWTVDGERKVQFLRLLIIVHAVIIFLGVIGCGAAATPTPAPHETSEAVTFTTEDGIELKGRLFGQGQTGVVLAHMYPADQRNWWAFAQVLAESGYMALAFDFRGYGDSGGDKDAKLSDRDVEAGLEFLRSQGASTVFLMGASMGGTASLKVAAREGVTGVVSLSAPVEFRGISVNGEQVRVPALLMATVGDQSAAISLDRMTEQGIVGGPELTERVLFVNGNDHGTDMLKGDNGAAATQRILSFLEAHSP